MPEPILCDILTYLEALDRGQAEMLARLQRLEAPSGVQSVALHVPVAPPPGIPERLADVERHHILATVAAAKGNRQVAAERLDISVRTLRHKLMTYGYTPERP